MKLLTLASVKGGVGRTTIALNLAHSLATKGMRILLVDADPQAGLTASLGPKVAKAPGLANVLHNDQPLEQAIFPTRLPTFHLLPWGQVEIEPSFSLHNHLQTDDIFLQIKSALEDHFDCMIIDTPAGIAGPTLGALLATDYVLSPLQASPLALRSVPRMLEALQWVHSQRQDRPLLWSSFVVNMWSSHNPLSIEVVQEIYERFPPDSVFQTMIPHATAVEEASAAMTSLPFFSKQLNPVATIFSELAEEFEAKWNPTQQESRDEPLSLVG